MSTHKVVLLLGSNLGDRKKYLKDAYLFINEKVGKIEKSTKFLETPPLEFTSTDYFLNQLLVVYTSLSPFALLNTVKDIEQQMGRTYHAPLPGEKYVSRCIDIDILTYDALKVDAPHLQIPHPQIHTRPFVKTLWEELEEEEKTAPK